MHTQIYPHGCQISTVWLALKVTPTLTIKSEKREKKEKERNTRPQWFFGTASRRPSGLVPSIRNPMTKYHPQGSARPARPEKKKKKPIAQPDVVDEVSEDLLAETDII